MRDKRARSGISAPVMSSTSLPSTAAAGTIPGGERLVEFTKKKETVPLGQLPSTVTGRPADAIVTDDVIKWRNVRDVMNVVVTDSLSYLKLPKRTHHSARSRIWLR